MRKVICLVLSIVMALSAVPVFAADNVVKLTGERIAIDEDTLSTVWEDQTGGTLVWDRQEHLPLTVFIMMSQSWTETMESLFR